jgi:hypothetical protein
MIFSPDKTLVAWNTEILDTYNDIIVSFDYERYSTFDTPRGGFCVVFYDSDIEVPKIGGPAECLGYTPTDRRDYCYIKGQTGFGNGFIGVGFDLNGDFGLKNNLVDGLDVPIPNSVTVRGSEVDGYKHIATSKNIAFLNRPFLIGDRFEENVDRFQTIRIIASKAFTGLKVQIKKSKDRDFYDIMDVKLPVLRRTGVKVAITNTVLDEHTFFNIKNFNVAGFPGVVTEPELRDCAVKEFLDSKVGERTIVSTNNFAAVPIGGNVLVYELKNGELFIKQIIEEEGPAALIGGNDKFLFLNRDNTDEVDVYFNINNSFLKTQVIGLSSDVYDVEPADIGGLPWCAATDNRFLMIGNKKNVFVFQYRGGGSTYGNFEFLQTLTNNPSGDIGYSVQLEEGRMLTGGGTARVNGRRNSFVSFYEVNGIDWNDLPTQTFSSPVTGNIYDEFGYTISMQGNEAIIGSPNEARRGRITVGHGEAYHYVYLRTRKIWRAAMSLANFYNIDSPGSNFGTSIAYLGNNLIVSAPYENYHFPPDLAYEDKPNTGRVYIFRKNRGGTFTQSANIAPDYDLAKPDMYFGKLVGLIGTRTSLVTIPFKSKFENSEIDAYKIGCIFDIPPPHLKIEENSIKLYDSSGYTIDMKSYTYLTLIQTDTTPRLPTILLPENFNTPT